jgi:putative flippase GtrA
LDAVTSFSVVPLRMISVLAGGRHLFRFAKYLVVGGTSTVIQYVILVFLVRTFGMAPTPASSIGFVLSASVNYLLNYRFTFESDKPHGPATAKFAVLAATGLLINIIVMRLLTGAGVQYLLAQICATALVLIWGFIGNTIWTFGVPVEERTRT